ncbi:MAG: hypothetical protein R3F20_17690 [Planctomycetota bacterium]
MRSLLPALLAGLLAFLAAPPLPAQGLAFVTAGPASAGGAPESQFGTQDIAFFTPGSGLESWFRRRGLDVLVGDLDGDGLLEDAPPAIDAIAHLPALADGPVGLLVSFTTNFTALDGTLVRDGDVVRLLGGGAVEITYAETDLAAATGTSAIDVDAFHVGDDGSIAFSFAEDETTSDPALIAQNGGLATLDEATVLTIAADGTTSILFTRDDVVALASAAAGQTLSSVVDTVGITADPDDPSAFLLTFASLNDAIEGQVISSAGGGIPFATGGAAFDSAGLGFPGLQSLQGLAWVDAPPPLLSLHHPAEVGLDATTAQFRVSGAVPGHTVRLGIAGTRFPADPVVTASGFNGRDDLLVALDDPFLAYCLSAPAFAATAGPDGSADFSFDITGLPPGTALTIQAFDVEALVLAPPIATLHAL